jgi:nicotinamidase/pyrazinamidase
VKRHQNRRVLGARSVHHGCLVRRQEVLPHPPIIGTIARALLIIDFQNDFTAGGALAVPDGDAIAPRVNELLDSGEFDLVVATRDWHPPDHASFKEQGGPWPPHCVQGSPGAELNAALDRERIDVVVDAGYERDLSGYSGFEETDLAETLRAGGVDEVTVVGLATDYCVKETAADALREGFGVEIDREGIRGIDVEPGDSERALDELRAAGARVS